MTWESKRSQKLYQVVERWLMILLVILIVLLSILLMCHPGPPPFDQEVSSEPSVIESPEFPQV